MESVAGTHNANPWWRRVVEDQTFRSEVTITMTRLVRQMERSYLSGELTATRHGQGHCEAQEELSRVDKVANHLSAATAAVFNGHRPEGFITSIQGGDTTTFHSSGHASAMGGRKRSSTAPRRHNTRHTLQESVLHATLPSTFIMCTQVPVSSLSDAHKECLVPVLRAICEPPSSGGDVLRSRAYTHAWRPHCLPPYYVPLLGPQPTDARGEEVEDFTNEIGRHQQSKRSRELHHAAKANRFLRQSRALQALNRGDRPHTTDSDEDDDRGCLRTAYGSVPFEGSAFSYPGPTNHPPDIYTQPPLVDVMPPPGFVLTSWSEAETPLIVAASNFSPVELAGESIGSKDPSKSKFLPVEPLRGDTTSAGRSLCGNSAEANWVYRRWVGRQRDSIYSQVLQYIVSDLVGSGSSVSNPSEGGGASAVPSGRYTNVSAVPLFNKLSNADRRLLAHYPSSLVGYDASLPRRLRTDLDPRTFGVKDGDKGDALFDFPTAVKTVHFKTPRKQWRVATGTRRVFTVSGKRQRIRGSSGASEKCVFEVSARAVFTTPPETDFYHRMHDDLSTRVYEVPIVDVSLDRRGVSHDAPPKKQDPHQTPSRPRSTVEKGAHIGSSYTSVASGVPPRPSPRIQPVSVHPPVPTVHECDRRWALAHNKPPPVLKGPAPQTNPTADRTKRPMDTNDDDHNTSGAVCRAPLPPRYLGTIRPSMRLTRWHLWCDAIRQRYEEEVRQATEADSSSRPPSSGPGGDCPGPLSTCRGNARVEFYETLLDGIPDHRAISSPITAGGIPALSVAESPPLHGLGRFDLTVHRHDALYRSQVCRDAMRRLYDQRERDSSDAHMNKIGFIGFVLDLFNLFMPCNRGRYNIAMAEDEWRLYSAHVFQRDPSRSDTAAPTKQVATAVADQLRSVEADQRAEMHRGNAMRLGHTVLCHQPLASVPPEALLTSIDTGSEVVLPPYVGDFNSFFDFFFSIPLIMYHGEVVTEELYVGFWEFVHESWYKEVGTTNEDRYDRYLHRAELAPVVATVPKSRRAFLVNRMADTMEHTKRPANNNSINTTADAILLASTSDDSEGSCQSDFPSLDYLEKQKSHPVLQQSSRSTANACVSEEAPEIPPSLNPVALEARSAYSLFKQGGLSALNGEAAGVATGDNMRIYTVPEYQRDELDNLLDFQSDVSSASSISYSSDDEGAKNLPRGNYLSRLERTDWDDTMSLSTAKGHRTRERYEALLRRRELIRRSAAPPDPIAVDESVDDPAAPSTLESDHVEEPVQNSVSPSFSPPPASPQKVKASKSSTHSIEAEVRHANTTATVENADVLLAQKLRVLRSRQVNEGPICVQPLQPPIDVPMDVGRMPDPTCRPRTSDRKVPHRTHLYSAGVERLSADASFVQNPPKTPVESQNAPTSARTPKSAIFFMSRPATASRPNTAPRPVTAPKPARRSRLSNTPLPQSSPVSDVVDAPRVVPRIGSPRCLLPNTDFTSPAIKSGKCRTNRPATTQGAHRENSPPPGPLSPSFLNYKNEDAYESEVEGGDIQTFWGSRQQGHFFKEAAGAPYDPSPHHCRLTGSSNDHVDVVVPKSITVTASGMKVRPPPRPSAALISLINKRHKATTPSVGMVQGTSRPTTPR